MRNSGRTVDERMRHRTIPGPPPRHPPTPPELRETARVRHSGRNATTRTPCPADPRARPPAQPSVRNHEPPPLTQAGPWTSGCAAARSRDRRRGIRPPRLSCETPPTFVIPDGTRPREPPAPPIRGCARRHSHPSGITNTRPHLRQDRGRADATPHDPGTAAAASAHPA